MKTQSTRKDHRAGQATTPHQRVLVADDDPNIRQLLELTLSSDGYEVICASNGHELVRLAQERIPGLILVDLMMPQMDGYEAIRQMRNDTRTAHIPMLILTARSRTGDVVVGFESGADDYIAKPFDLAELLARVKSHLRRAAQRPVLNPLTGAPGGMLLSQELRHRLASDAPLALLYADLDNFKAFNDAYGFSRGDQAILLVAHIIQSVVAMQGNPDDFIGHIGGDDFAVLTTPDRVDAICRALIATFDREMLQLYPKDDRRRGYLTAADRHGILRRFNLMSISIGVATSQRRNFSDEEEFTRVAAEMKQFAKAQAGSSYAMDQRIADQRVADQSSATERRRAHQRNIVIVSDDGSLRSVLRSTLQGDNYPVQEAADIATLERWLDEEPPALVLADAQLGEPLWAFCTAHASVELGPPIVVLAYDDEEVERARAAGATACLQQPLPLTDIVACVGRLVRVPYDPGDNAARSVGSSQDGTDFLTTP
jgi:diguanylate cyclase (GGDEF)-like protein